MNSSNNKLSYADGLRGFAAFIVFLFHYIAFGMGYQFILLKWIDQQNVLIKFIFKFIFAIILNGNFSVCLFFILSGFVLSLSFFKNNNEEVLISGFVRRYFRLVVPVFFSVVLLFICGQLHVFISMEEAKKLGIIPGPNIFLDVSEIPDFFSMLKYTFFDCIFKEGKQYNKVLWTMHVEFLGSLFVYFFLGIFGKNSFRYALYPLFILFFINTYYYCFFVGVFLADMYTQKKIKIILPFNTFTSFIVLLLGIFITIFYYNDKLYEALSLPTLTDDLKPVYNRIGSVLIFLAVISSDPIQKFLNNRFFLFLGKISFVLYLNHVVIYSVFSPILLSFLIPYNFSVLQVIVINVLLTIIVVLFISRCLLFTDNWGIQVSKWVYGRLKEFILKNFTPANIANNSIKI